MREVNWSNVELPKNCHMKTSKRELLAFIESGIELYMHERGKEFIGFDVHIITPDKKS